MPDLYDRCLGPVLFAPYARHLAGIAANRRPTRVLELAAGTGILTAELVRALPAASITATDLNPAMVDWGRAHVPGATWEIADAQHLEFPPASFDLVVCQFGAMFFPDRVGAFAEAARVLAPGGTLVLAIWDVVEASTLTAALVDALAQVRPDAPPSFVVRVPHGYADPGRITADVEAGGLGAVDLQRVVLPTRAESAAELARGFCLGSPLRFELEAQGPVEELTEAVAVRMTEQLGAGPVDGELAAFVVTARCQRTENA
jgi:SAM-dependent methyltransferase